MRTFSASIRSVHLWIAVVFPPVLFGAHVQIWANGLRQGELSAREMLLLFALAPGMPLGALAWMICSIAAYSVGEGRLIVHRVMGDRGYPLDELTGPPVLDRGVVTVPFRSRTLALRVDQPSHCLAAIEAAVPPPFTPARRAVDAGGSCETLKPADGTRL